VADARKVIEDKIPLATFVDSSEKKENQAEDEDAEQTNKDIVEINYKILEIAGSGRG